MVDLPAPFCPISACTSPRDTSNRASRSADTPRNCLLMPRIDSRSVERSVTQSLLSQGWGRRRVGGHPRAGRDVAGRARDRHRPGPAIMPGRNRPRVGGDAQYALSTLAAAFSLVNSWSLLMIRVGTDLPAA